MPWQLEVSLRFKNRPANVSHYAKPTVKRIIIFLLLITSIIAGVIYFDIASLAGFGELKARQLELQTLVDNNPRRSAVIFFLVYVATAAISIPGALVLTLAGGALFGLLKGSVLVSFASTLGALLAFLVARYFLRASVQNKFPRRLALVNRKIQQEGAFYLLFIRLAPVLPFFLVNLAMALTPMRAFTFYWVSQLGMLPATVIYVNAGTEMAKISSPQDIISPALLVALALLGILPLLTKNIVNMLKNQRVYKKFKKPRHFQYHTIVLGGGAAGLVAACTTRILQGKVALIERHQMGGDCLNTGCVPSKSMLRSAKFVADIRRYARYGLAKAAYEADFKTIMEHVDHKIARIKPKDSVERYSQLGVDCRQGEAEVISPWEVRVNNHTLTTKNIIVATGARPAMPAIAGLENTPCYTTDTIWSLSALPEKLCIIGGGPVGCELSQAFARLGSQVTLVHKHTRILSNEDEQVAKVVAASLSAEGVSLQTDFITEKIADHGKGYCLTGTHRGLAKSIAFSHLLIATGRKASLDGLAALDLETSQQGGIVTNETLQTNYPNIYACGDVTGAMQHTHSASHQAWYAAFNALFHPLKKFKCKLDNIPRAVFTDPEIASLGLTEKQARQASLDYQVTEFPMSDIDRAITDSATEGFIKVITPAKSDKILGVCMVGEHASELMAEFVLAKTHGLGLNKILQSVHIYPTRGEINRMVAGKWRRSKISPRTINLLSKFQRWRLGH